MAASRCSARPSLTRTGVTLLTGAVLLGAAGCSLNGQAPEPGVEEAPANADTRIVTTSEGDVEIPAVPERIVVLNPAWTGYFYALDVPVHAAVPLNTDSSEFPAMYAEQPLAADTERVPWSNDGFDLEFIQLTEPDLIVGGGHGWPGGQSIEVYDDLSGIAPTVIGPGDMATWQEELEFVADDVLGVPDRAAELEQNYQDRVGQVQDAIDAPPLPVGYVLLQADERRWSIPETAALPQLMADAGLEPYPVAEEHPQLEAFGSGDSLDVPSELASEVFVAPSLFVTGFQVDNVDLDALATDPIIGSLPAFETGQTYELPPWAHRPDYFGALLLLDEIERLFG